MPSRYRQRLPWLAAAAAVVVLSACSKYDYVRIATSGDPAQAVASLARGRVESYQHNPIGLVQDIRRTRREFNKLVGLLRGEVGRTWGRDEVVTPSNKRYVKYTQNYKSRALVQFDRGLVRVETVDTENPERSLGNAIVTTLLTPEDPRAVDLYSDRTVRLSGKPYLYGLLEDHRGRAIGGPRQAEEFARFLVQRRMQQRKVDTGRGKKSVRYVELSMVSDYENRQARRYAPLVRKYAGRYNVSESLIYAVIKTESNFNPFAVSSAPAFGLMQLVPATGGRDAFRQIKGYDHTPSRDYLFIPENNIELGTAYLSMLDRKYLGRIRDPVTREYCTISAYNGGAGNVLYMFSQDRDRAVEMINGLPAAEIYRRLREEHPRQETRRYLMKVLNARRQFVSASL